MGMLDYDNIDDWAPRLSAALVDVVADHVRASIAAYAPEYIEDACAHLFSLVSPDHLITATLQWLGANTIAAYHGSRLTDEEVASIRRDGLLPLDALSRRSRLARALRGHRDWAALEPRLDREILAHGPHNRAGHREGQVHLTLSRAGLVNGFNHYLRRGAEFDQHVAHALLGLEGYQLLEADGRAVVIQVELSGDVALAGAHPHFTIEDMRLRGEVPNIVREFLETWSYRLFDPAYQTKTQELDCGISFCEAVPPRCIRGLDILAL